MSIRVRLLLLALVVLGLAGHAAYWFHVAGALRKGIESFADDRRAEGWTVVVGQPHLSGYPLAVQARLEGPSLTSPGGVSWHPDAVTVFIPLLSPLTPRLEIPGHHRLAFPGWSAILSATELGIHLSLTPEGEADLVSVEGRGLSLDQPGLDPIVLDSGGILAQPLRPADHGHETPFLGLSLWMTGLGLPDMSGLPLSRRVDSLRLEARVMGTPPDGPPLAALAGWSRDGGTVELDHLALEWTPLSLDGEGTLALDPALQPLLASTIHVRGWSEFVARLVQAGLVEPGKAEAARMMMGILARPDALGRPALTISMSIQDGVLTAGQIPVLKLPPLPLAPAP